jgi:hypothetical protein
MAKWANIAYAANAAIGANRKILQRYQYKHRRHGQQ